MKIKTIEQQLYLLAAVLSTGWVLSTATVAHAQLTGTGADEFEHIEQPLPLKAAITTLGIGLIGFELWWFLLSRPKAQPSQSVANQAAANPSITNPSITNLSAANPSAANPSAVNSSITHPPTAKTPAANQDAAKQNDADEIALPTLVTATPELPTPELPPQAADSIARDGHAKLPNNNLPEKLTVGLCALYNGIEMAREMLVVEHKVQPKFSMG